MRIVPGFFGAALLVPSAVDPKIASDNVPPVARDGTTSAVLLASVYPGGTSKSAFSRCVTWSSVTSCVDVVTSALSASPLVVVVVTLTGNPSFTSPTVFASTTSVQAPAGGRGAWAGGRGH